VHKYITQDSVPRIL